MTVIEGIKRDFRGFSFLQGLMLLLIGAATLQVTWWAMDRTPPVETTGAVADGPAIAGGTLVVTYTVERHRSCPYKVDRLVRTSNGAMVPLVDDEWAASPGSLGRDVYKVYVALPLSVDPGPASYRVILSYRCNLLQYLYPIIVRNETPFVVATR